MKEKKFPSKEEFLKVWKKPLGERVPNSLTRTIPTDYGVDFKIMYNSKRASRGYVVKKCPFDDLRRLPTLEIGDYIICRNTYPFSKKHRLIITKKHQSLPKLKDLKFGVFCSELIDDTIILSIKDSGAGVPFHLHFHTFREKLPALNAECAEIASNNEVSVGRLVFPSYCIKISGKNVPKWLFRIIKTTKYPYNLVIHNGIVLLYPRTVIYPTESVKWPFGATELSGFFVSKTKELFETLTKEQAANYLRKATLEKKNKIKAFEKTIKETINGGHY